MKGRAIPYSVEELAWVAERQEMPRRDLWQDFRTEWGRWDVSFENFKAMCTRKGFRTRRDGRFRKGTVPPNAGRKGYCPPGSEKGHFRKGGEPHNTKWLGHERISKDGYVEVSVAETNPHTGYGRRYVQKHRWLWEKANGPVPEGHCLKSLDGDKTNTDPANWIAIPRAMMPRLNGRFGRNYDSAPAELKPLILATVRLEHAAREAAKGEREA